MVPQIISSVLYWLFSTFYIFLRFTYEVISSQGTIRKYLLRITAINKIESVAINYFIITSKLKIYSLGSIKLYEWYIKLTRV